MVRKIISIDSWNWKHNLITFWIIFALWVIYSLLPIKIPGKPGGTFNENRLLLQYTGATCFDIMPLKGLDDIERKYNKKVECFFVKDLNLSYEVLCATKIIANGYIEKIDDPFDPGGPPVFIYKVTNRSIYA